MVYYQPFLRLVAQGKLYGVEDFAFSMSYIVEKGVTPNPPETVPNAVLTAFQTFWADTVIGQGARLTTIKLNLIDVDGKYAGQETVRHDFNAPGLAAGGVLLPPPQISYVVSLQTAYARGRAHAGRFYLPLPSYGVDNTGRLPLSAVQNIQGDTDTFLSALQTAVPGWELGVVSNVGTGEQRGVTHARYGRVLDTVRSRREKFLEEYVTGTTLPDVP